MPGQQAGGDAVQPGSGVEALDVEALATLERHPEELPTRSRLIELLKSSKKYDAAEEVFRKILATDPTNAMVLNYLGYMLADRGVRVEEALGYIKKAVDQEPQNGAYLDSLGWAYFKLNNMELAEENLRKASEHIPNDPTVHQHLGDVYQKTGRLRIAAAQWERAIDEWNRSVPADVDNDELARVQKELESARVKLAKQQTK